VATDTASFGIGRVTRFYVPLVLHAISQALTYPLVAGIVSHGRHGVDAYTAFSMGLTVMNMILAIGGGLVMTGMVFAKTRKGYCEFVRLNTWMMVSLLLLQCVPALNPFYRWVFSGWLALSPELVPTARWVLVGAVVMGGSFFLRNVPMVVLLNNFESGKVNLATFARILATLMLSLTFPRFGLVGPGWGLFALTFGVVVEFLVTWAYARPYVRRLPGDDGGEHVSLLEQLRFTLPLSLGGFMLMLSSPIMASFVGRSADAADMLAIHYTTHGAANPVGYAGLKMQAVSIKFPPEHPGDHRLLWYAVCSGALLGLVPLAFSIPAIGDWYFGEYQNMPARMIPTARMAVAVYAVFCIIQSVRGRVEGLAAIAKRSRAVMVGQIGYTCTIVAVLAVMLKCGVPGWLMAVLSIMTAAAGAGACVYAALAVFRHRHRAMTIAGGFIR